MQVQMHLGTKVKASGESLTFGQCQKVLQHLLLVWKVPGNISEMSFSSCLLVTCHLCLVTGQILDIVGSALHCILRLIARNQTAGNL